MSSVPIYEAARRQKQKTAAVNEDKFSKDLLRHAVIQSGMQGYAAEGRINALGSASRRK
jgi:thiamine biosynthesis protein ThiC